MVQNLQHKWQAITHKTLGEVKNTMADVSKEEKEKQRKPESNDEEKREERSEEKKKKVLYKTYPLSRRLRLR